MDNNHPKASSRAIVTQGAFSTRLMIELGEHKAKLRVSKTLKL